ncbi:MAG: DUF3570 domain-containing protein [Polyangiaceae bacterium]|nr:DUF3570 domain-containing protein [Polyangiaceae bacterium]
MRVSLATVVAMAMTQGCAGSSATHSATSRVHFYDDPRLSVLSPAVRDDMELGDFRLGAGYAVDVVSGATQALTVDAVSSATRFSERRHQAGASVGYAPSPETELSGGYALSSEPDHTVHAPSAGVTWEMLDRMVRASLRYQLLAESIGRVDDLAFSADALGHRLDLGWTQITTRTLVVTLLGSATAYDCDAAIGCFANPYRYVGVGGLSGGRAALGERHPDTRVTGAGALRAAWGFSGASALHAGYRFSMDTWAITAHTGDAAFVTELIRDRLLARAEARATTQTAASFYRARYLGGEGSVPAYRTADSELSPLWNVKLGLHLEWDLGPLRLVGELGRMWNQYPEFPALPSRHAWTGGLGLDAEL